MGNLTRKDKANPTQQELWAEHLEANRGADPRNTWLYAVETLEPLIRAAAHQATASAAACPTCGHVAPKPGSKPRPPHPATMIGRK